MKRRIVLLSIIVASAVTLLAAGCADSEDSSGAATPEGDAAPSVLPEAAAEDGARADGGDASAASDARADADAGPLALCSDAGFCRTPLPAPGDGGATQTLADVWSDGAGVAWSVTKEGRILRWESGTWTTARDGSDALAAVWGSSPTDLWVGGAKGLLHGTGATSATLTWSAVASLPGDALSSLVSIWGTSATNVWAVGGRDALTPENLQTYVGRLLHFDGTSWKSDTSVPNQVSFVKVWGDAIDVWMAAKDFSAAFYKVGLFHKRADNSGAWVETTPADGCSRSGLYGLNISTLAAGGNAANVIVAGSGSQGTTVCTGPRATDGGAGPWTANVYAPDNAARTGLWSSGPNDVWVVGQYGRVDHFDGTKWLPARISLDGIPFTNDFAAIYGRPGQELWMVGTDIAYRKVLP